MAVRKRLATSFKGSKSIGRPPPHRWCHRRFVRNGRPLGSNIGPPTHKCAILLLAGLHVALTIRLTFGGFIRYTRLRYVPGQALTGGAGRCWDTLDLAVQRRSRSIGPSVFRWSPSAERHDRTQPE